jgi:hypothetical protein
VTVFHIKLIAITAMVIDHVGLYFFPDISIFRIIGRLAFPLFAWLIANGAYYTKNHTKYLLRLGLFAGISQIPYWLIHQGLGDSYAYLNIFFTLTLSLFAILLIKKTQSKFLWLVITICAAFLAEVTRMDYGAFGIFSVVFYFIFFKNFKKLVLSQVLIYTSIYLVPVIGKVSSGTALLADDYSYLIQLFALFALIIIRRYNGKLGVKLQYAFYIIYPAHLLFFYILKKMINQS